ncbi:MAG: uracil-DNA glycosylase family protein [Janthinobacterium lividum]
MSQDQTRRDGFLAEMGLGPRWRARVGERSAMATEPDPAGQGNALPAATIEQPVRSAQPSAMSRNLHTPAEEKMLPKGSQATGPAVPHPPVTSTATVGDAWSDEELASAWNNAVPLPSSAAEPGSSRPAAARSGSANRASNASAGAQDSQRPTSSGLADSDLAGASAGHVQVGPTAEEIAGMDWEQLKSAVACCVKCKLCHSRTKTVFGTGDQQAGWLFVGEGPGRNEDQQGEPFVGPAGKLLDNMLLAMQLRRGENAYIANIVKCRPTGADGRDRPPEPEEAAACLPYLERQIALLQPSIVVALGKTAAVSLLDLPPSTTLSGLRGKVHARGSLPLIATFHPAYLLRKLSDKAKSWSDLCLAIARFGAKAEALEPATQSLPGTTLAAEAGADEHGGLFGDQR